jgi:hypothetical protein
MPTINQILSASYPHVVAEKRKPTNQFSDSALMRELDRQGAIVKVDLGATIEATLDYRRNPGAQVLATDLTPTSTTKTEVLTAASYSPASVSVPIVWSKQDEATNGTKAQKVDLVDSLINNALDSHDDLFEQTLFTGSNGLIGFDTLITNDGTGTIGGIVAGTDTWWKNKFDQRTGSSDMVASMTEVWNLCTKGSGSQMMPKILVSDAATQAIFEGTQQSNQRYIDTDDLKAGFKTLAFKTARYVFSPYGSTKVIFLNPKVYQIRVSKAFYRALGELIPLESAEGYKRSVYTAGQVVTTARNRLGVSFL